MNEIRIALGGGGARGLAHLKVLEFFDHHDISVTRIAGTSIGAIVGALYASGKSACEIQEQLHQYVIFKKDRKRSVMKKIPKLLSWFSMLNMDTRQPGVIRADAFLKNFIQDLETIQFEDLEIPLTIAATDYWTGKEVIFDSGPLKPAVLASSAIPGMFPAVQVGDQVLVDGALSNCVPFSHFKEDGPLSVAIDVTSDRTQTEHRIPKMTEAAEGVFDIVFDNLIQQQLEICQPDVFFRPGIEGVSILEFDKIERIYEQTEKALPELKRMCMEKGLTFKEEPGNSDSVAGD
jgi:NTE family protein